MNALKKSNFVARLAINKAEIEAAQRLRFDVFYQELSAKPNKRVSLTGRDIDKFDEICEHILVVYTGPSSMLSSVQVIDGELVGTYRLLPQQVAQQNFGFYSQTEFDVAPLLAAKENLSFLELGRSCVAEQFRTKPVLELLWQEIWNYVREHNVDVLMGCASIVGTDPKKLKLPLSYLATNHQPPSDWMVSAQPTQELLRITAQTLTAQDSRKARLMLPPLIRSYLRIGAYIGDEAVVDYQFGTTDVLVLLPISNIKPNYFDRFGYPPQSPAKQ